MRLRPLRSRRPVLLLVHQQVARLTLQLATERLQRREADRACLVGLENGQVRQRDPDTLAQLRERHPALLEQPIERYLDSHGYITSDCSFSSSEPRRKISASATMTSATNT